MSDELQHYFRQCFVANKLHATFSAYLLLCRATVVTHGICLHPKSGTAGNMKALGCMGRLDGYPDPSRWACFMQMLEHTGNMRNQLQLEKAGKADCSGKIIYDMGDTGDTRNQPEAAGSFGWSKSKLPRFIHLDRSEARVHASSKYTEDAINATKIMPLLASTTAGARSGEILFAGTCRSLREEQASWTSVIFEPQMKGGGKEMVVVESKWWWLRQDGSASHIGATTGTLCFPSLFWLPLRPQG
ncbi:hypothetical protein B0H14DRAFT_2573782 [Mycena olivaceomarginata]|nr:hypothetical protein B0H14DRAFT_2573782 [Mycena olivaceomarginata]